MKYKTISNRRLLRLNLYLLYRYFINVLFESRFSLISYPNFISEFFQIFPKSRIIKKRPRLFVLEKNMELSVGELN